MALKPNNYIAGVKKSSGKSNSIGIGKQEKSTVIRSALPKMSNLITIGKPKLRNSIGIGKWKTEMVSYLLN